MKERINDLIKYQNELIQAINEELQLDIYDDCERLVLKNEIIVRSTFIADLKQLL